MISYEGSIWRPPSEASSLILQATVGCSHNACIFCVSYKNKKYRIRGAESIEADLKRLSDSQKRAVQRVFLADGNALAMPTDDLTQVLHVLSNRLPSLERVGIYGYAKDVRRKSVDDLRRLREAGLGIVYFGLETGDDETLDWCMKGVDRTENVKACKKIRAGGIPLSITIILGLGGLKNSNRHAVATAEALNEIDPEYTGALTLMTPIGTEIHRMVTCGEFTPMEPMETLQELRTLVEHLNLSCCVFRTNHASNYLAIGGTMNRDRERVLDLLDRTIALNNPNVLRRRHLRGL